MGIFTKEIVRDGIVLSARDAEEFRAYKRRKKVEEIMAAVGRSESVLLDEEDVGRVCERALRLKQAGVKTPLSRSAQVKGCLGEGKVWLDCIVGGSGETLTAVKAFEIKTALRQKAKEITVMLTPSDLATCRYTSIARELKRLRRMIKKAVMKVAVGKIYPGATMARLARMSGELGAQYFSVPYYEGCEKLRYDLKNGCKLEVCGVRTLSDFKKMTEAGTIRIVTANIWDIYSEWMKEAEREGRMTQNEEKKDEKTDERKADEAIRKMSRANAQAATLETKPQEEKRTELPNVVTPPTIVDPPKKLPVSVAAVKETSAQENANTGLKIG